MHATGCQLQPATQDIALAIAGIHQAPSAVVPLPRTFQAKRDLRLFRTVHSYRDASEPLPNRCMSNACPSDRV